MGDELDRMFHLEASDLTSDLARSLLLLAKTPERADLLSHCFRLAHTLKGAARVVRRTAISELAHTMEETLSPYRENGEPIELDAVNDLLKVLELIRAELQQSVPASMNSVAPTATSAYSGASARFDRSDRSQERIETIRVELKDLDALLAGLAEARTQLSGLRAVHGMLQRAQRTAADLLTKLEQREQVASASSTGVNQRMVAEAEELHRTLLQAQREAELRLGRGEQELTQSYELLGTLRLVPVSTVFEQIELAAYDAAQLVDKRVSVELVGGDVRVEANILLAVRDVLLHLIRNAIDHGIEPRPQRLHSGKPAEGRLTVTAERRGRRVTFLCSDDGAGINVDAVRAAAIARGAVTAEAAAQLSPQETLQLIFAAGVSTRRTVTQLSGRGVGLDVVRATAARFNGNVSVTSKVGQGSAIGITVPTSLTSLMTLALAFSDQTVLLPLDAVRGAVRLGHNEIIQEPTRNSIVYEGQALAFLPLTALFGLPVVAQEMWSAVIVQAGAQRVVLGAERLAGTMEVVVKPLPLAVGAHAFVSGAALDLQGDPLFVLDPRGLIKCHPSDARVPLERSRGPLRLPVLVVDDSLTTRMLEQSILEAAGYEVDLADSAEEGLSMAHLRSYGLFIVDIEMPGMSGFEFTALTRADPELQQIPVVLVTSLSSPEHRRRGLEVGAAAYLVKSEFDQNLFVEKIAQLIK
ncbi:MAG: response regulator [Verrucomicrobiota bacterium]